MSIIPKHGDPSKAKCRSDIILSNIFPKIKTALFDLDMKYKKPGETLFYCHFCDITSENDQKLKNHIETQEHASKVEERRKYLDELIESFYTAVQTKSVTLQKNKAAFNVCAKCLMPYVDSAKKHRQSPEHNYSIGFIRPACFKCNKLFANRIDQEIHQVTLDHIFTEVAYNQRKALTESKTVEIPEEYDENVAVGLEYVRNASAFYCTPCGMNLNKTLKTLKDHCMQQFHIENVKMMEEKLKPLRLARQQELENAPPAKKMKGEEECENQESEAEEDTGAQDGGEDAQDGGESAQDGGGDTGAQDIGVAVAEDEEMVVDDE